MLSNAMLYHMPHIYHSVEQLKGLLSTWCRNEHVELLIFIYILLRAGSSVVAQDNQCDVQKYFEDAGQHRVL